MEYIKTLPITKKILWVFPLCLIFYELPLYFANNMYLPALPEMSQAFGIKANFAQLSIAIWFLGASCFQVFLGPIADQFGYRKVLLSSGIFFIVASLLCATTQHFTLFLIARFIQGCVVSSILVTGYATINELLDTEQAIKTLSWMGGVTVLAPAIGPLLGSFFIKITGWRNIFFLLSILALIALYFLYLYMPKTQGKKQALKVRKVIQHYQCVISNKNFLRFTFLFCLLFAGMMCWDTLSPFYIIEFLGFSTLFFGVIQAIVYGGFIAGTHVVRIFINHINAMTRYGLFITFVFLIFTGLGLHFIPHHSTIILFFLTVFIFNTGLIFYTLHRKAIESVEAPMGIKMAVFSSAMNLFGFLGSLLATTLKI